MANWARLVAEKGLTQPDLMIAAGFSYEVVTAHNGCLQMEVTARQDGPRRRAAHRRGRPGARCHPERAVRKTMNTKDHVQRRGHQAPYLNVGREGGTNTNVVPGKVMFKLDRRMIPEENPVEVEATIRHTITQATAERAGLSVEIKRLLANAMTPLAGNQPLVDDPEARPGRDRRAVPAVGTPLYTDVRLYVERGIPGVIYGAGPRTVLESRQTRRRTAAAGRPAPGHKVIARALRDLLAGLKPANVRGSRAARWPLHTQPSDTNGLVRIHSGCPAIGLSMGHRETKTLPCSPPGREPARRLTQAAGTSPGLPHTRPPDRGRLMRPLVALLQACTIRGPDAACE